MLIAWTGALVNGSNVFPSIKDSKLRVLKELLTIDFAWRAASQVHYKGELSPYCQQQGHCTNNRGLRVGIALLFRTKNCFNHLLFCTHWLQSRCHGWMLSEWLQSLGIFFTINTHFKWAQKNGTISCLVVRKKIAGWELVCNWWGFLSPASQGETVFLLVAF